MYLLGFKGPDMPMLILWACTALSAGTVLSERLIVCLTHL